MVAVLAAIIASQAFISGTFSIIQQSLTLGCFPRVKVVHTSTKHQGQVYIPEVNYLLMCACVLLTLAFRTSTDMGNAYGIVVVFVMTLTSAFLVLIMILIWKTNMLLVISYVLVFLSVELLFLSSVLSKFTQGGYLPLGFALFLVSIMYMWNHVYRKKYYFELQNKIALENLKEIMQETNSHRLKGLAIFYSELVHGIPPIFKHYVDNVPALHYVLVFVSFKFLPINKVSMEERFLFRTVQPQDLRVFRCVVRYGYKDDTNEEGELEKMMYDKLREFFQEGGGGNRDDMVKSIEDVDGAWRSGVVHMVGEQEVVAAKGAGMFKKVVIDYAYNFFKRNLRQSNRVYDIPHQRMLKVGMIVEL